MSKAVAISQLFDLVRSTPKTVPADVIQRVDEEIAVLNKCKGKIPREGLDSLSFISVVAADLQNGKYETAQLHCKKAEKGFDSHLKQHLKDYYAKLARSPPKVPPLDYDQGPKIMNKEYQDVGTSQRGQTQQKNVIQVGSNDSTKGLRGQENEEGDGRSNSADSRPEVLARQFKALYDDIWSDAHDYLLSKMKIGDEKKVVETLLKVIQLVYQLCHDSSQRQLSSIRDSFATITLCVGTPSVGNEDLHCQVVYDAVPGRKKETGLNAVPGRKCQDIGPTVDAVPGRRRNDTVKDSGEYRTLTTEVDKIFREQRRALLALRTSVMDKLSADIEKVGTEIIVKRLPENLQKNDVMLLFIQKCLRVCWKMCQHEPPVHIDFPDNTQDLPFDSQRFKPYRKSGSRVHFIVWPALYLHTGGSLLSKGVAEGH